MSNDLIARVRARRKAERISLRTLAELTGVSFSTLARVERGECEYNNEVKRRIMAWLGDEVRHIVSAAERAKAEELGRYAARAYASEIKKIIASALSEKASGKG